MTRLARRDYYEDDDYFGNITEGIKTGMGIAQAYHNIENAKSSREFNQAQLEDFNRGKESRESEYDLKTAKNRNEMVLTEAEYKTILGSATSNAIHQALNAKNPEEGIKYLENNLKDITDGNIDAKFNPVTGPDGAHSGYAVAVTTKQGRQTINVANLQEFAGLLDRERLNAGYLNIGERDFVKRINIAKSAWENLGAERQAQYGSYDAFIKDPDVLDHIDLMASKDLSYTEAARTKKTWGQDDRKFESQMKTEKLRQDSIGLDMQRTRQGMGFDAENQKYLVEVTRKYDEALKNAQLRNDEAAFYRTLSEAIEVRFPELQPTYASIPATDSINGLAGLGVGAGTQKKQYSDEQLAKKKYIIQVHDTLPQDMPLEQKWEVIDAKLAEQKKTPPPAKDDANQSGDSVDKKRRQKLNAALRDAQSFIDERNLDIKAKTWGGAPALGIEGILEEEERRKLYRNRPGLIR